MKFYKVVARPTLLYGSETWVTMKRDMARLEAAEMRFLISVMGYARLDKIRSEVIRKELKISGIQNVKSKSKRPNPWRKMMMMMNIYAKHVNVWD